MPLDIHWEVLQDPGMIARLILQVLLFAASALFSMSETAFFSLRETDLQKLDGQNPAQAKRIRSLIGEPRQLIVSILCGNELINIAATINLAGIFLALFDNPGAAAVANTAVMLPLLLILGEITPKTLAVTQPLTMASKLVEPVISPWVRIVMPLRAVVRVISDAITGMIIGTETTSKNILSTDEFKTLLSDVEKEGIVNEVERGIILRLIEAGDTPVTHIMVPRPRIIFADVEQPVPEILALFREARHRRLPVFRGHRDNVLGMIKAEQVMKATLQTDWNDIHLDDILEPTSFAPTTATVSDLAELFKSGNHHGALVINEFGGVEGMVTADDVFDFLTTRDLPYLDGCGTFSVDDDVLRCAGLTPVRQLKGLVPFPLPDQEDMTTIGGLVLALKGRLPQEGDMIRESGVIFRVDKMDGLLIDQLTIAPVDDPVFADLTEAAE